MKRTMITARLLYVILLCTFPCLGSQQRKSKNILILHDGWRDLAMNSLSEEELRGVLGAEKDLDVQYFEEYTETYRLGTEYAALAEMLRQKYSGKHIDVVVAVGQTALRFLCAYSKRLWPGVPVVFFMVETDE